MSKTITLRLEDSKYELFRKHAELDNRAISNFIETATERYILENEFVSDLEMKEIISNNDLVQSINSARLDIKKGQRKQIG